LHDHDIAHRDIKPENIVISNVPIPSYRMLANYVISDGLLSVMKEERPIAELLIMQLPKFYKAKITI
jgi:serine/threonine protein kinase